MKDGSPNRSLTLDRGGSYANAKIRCAPQRLIEDSDGVDKAVTHISLEDSFSLVVFQRQHGPTADLRISTLPLCRKAASASFSGVDRGMIGTP